MQFEHEDGIRSSTRRARIVEVDDSRSQQRLKIKGLKNEEAKKIWRTQDFGFSSVPPADSDGIFEQLGSRSDRSTYRDAGHEKYRPKNTPEGGTVLFNHSGDIIRVFKDNLDAVHSKKINIRIGHGYDAGNSGNDGDAATAIDDKQSDDTKTISIVAEDGVGITLTYEGSTIVIRDDGHIIAKAATQFSGGVDGGRWVVVRSGRIDLGVTDPDGTATPQVVTTSGPSTKVFCVVS